jgi:hypothetical protein
LPNDIRMSERSCVTERILINQLQMSDGAAILISIKALNRMRLFGHIKVTLMALSQSLTVTVT